jgi:hypothetical protein
MVKVAGITGKVLFLAHRRTVARFGSQVGCRYLALSWYAQEFVE